MWDLALSSGIKPGPLHWEQRVLATVRATRSTLGQSLLRIRGLVLANLSHITDLGNCEGPPFEL